MRIFKTGFIEDDTPREYPSYRELIASPGIAQAQPDMVRFRGPWIWQGDYGMCFPCAVSRAEYMGRTLLDATEHLISPTFSYLTARLQPFSGFPREMHPQTVGDIGCQAGYLMDALHNVGVVLEPDYPAPGKPGFSVEMGWDVPASKAFQDIIEKAYDARGLVLHEVDAPKGSRLGAMDALLRSYRAPILVWRVDFNYMQNRGQVVTTMNEADRAGGFHAQVALQIQKNGEVQVDNWWRNDTAGYLWGNTDGTCPVDGDLIEQMDSVRIFALRNAPLVRGRL